MEGNASSSSTVVQQTQDKHQFEKRRKYSSWCPDPRAQLLRGVPEFNLSNHQVGSYKLHVPSQYHQRTCMQAWTKYTLTIVKPGTSSICHLCKQLYPLYREKRESIFLTPTLSILPPTYVRPSMRRRIRVETCDPSSNPSRSYTSDPAFLSQS